MGLRQYRAEERVGRGGAGIGLFKSGRRVGCEAAFSSLSGLSDEAVEDRREPDPSEMVAEEARRADVADGALSSYIELLRGPKRPRCIPFDSTSAADKADQSARSLAMRSRLPAVPVEPCRARKPADGGPLADKRPCSTRREVATSTLTLVSTCAAGVVESEVLVTIAETRRRA